MMESALTWRRSSRAQMSSFRKSAALQLLRAHCGRAFLSPHATFSHLKSCVAVLQVLSYHATCSKTEVDKFKVTLRIFNHYVDLWKHISSSQGFNFSISQQGY